MASSLEKLKELELTRTEVDRIGEALKKPEFRQLLAEYVEEIQNPENRKLYEEEITQLEKERGIDVTFINPEPGYVIKTSADGDKKCFVNVSSNEKVAKPRADHVNNDGRKGVNWSLPHSMTPAREDLDNKGARCVVYDVVFHPEVLQRAEGYGPFKDMVNTTALEAVERNFGVTLDKKNAKFPKLKYKGIAHPAMIRKPSTTPGLDREGFEKDLFDKIYNQVDASMQHKPKKSKSPDSKKSIHSYTTPKYVIKHRTHVDIQEFTENKDSKMHAATPKELIIEVNMPLIKCSSDITLDVTEKTLDLISEKPAKYKLSLTLPYRVNEDIGSAKFDKDAKKLIVTLPVKRAALSSSSLDFCDSGVDSDQGSPTATVFGDDFRTINPHHHHHQESAATAAQSKLFLDGEVHYNVPEFTCHLFENTLVITLNVKNVAEDSVVKSLQDDKIHLKFSSVSSSFYTTHYALYLNVPHQNLNETNFTLEVWDNNVIIQIVCDTAKLDHFLYGLDSNDLSKKIIEEPTILNDVLSNPIPEEPELVEVDGREEKGRDQTASSDNEKQTGAISIFGTSSYESSGDELSCSFSPSRSRGILKRLSSANRYFVGRSVSESSLDDYVCSSVELDSGVIPEEDPEISTSLKKTVRFSDVIMRQLYRSNSSILGQKKKNQRKSRNKKRAQERRYSESEASEGDEKKDDMKAEGNDSERDDDEPQNHIHDIFHMDMN